MEEFKDHIAYVAFGSNLGDKAKNCAEAIHRLHEHSLCELLRVSLLYETEPLSLPNQKENPWFMNGVLKLKTQLGAAELLNLLREIEQKMGRSPEEEREKWGPRVIDLDLLFFDKEILKSKTLILPHPELHHRRFVLEPLCEIAPDLIHPLKGQSVHLLLKNLKDSKKVVPLFNFYRS
ncbi:MAG: 2-amino-4-hydroxy-6-hydroxymethyldihydropteridine diphosphokinase [Deltaproteobacteria bacterium]|nr:2-amino-4-hydroxy-6-hydroxymethyldihydropteridine diphosphokinase [Deltaproteobacteria bacterium]